MGNNLFLPPKQDDGTTPQENLFLPGASKNLFLVSPDQLSSFKVTDIPGVKAVAEAGRTLTDSVLDFVSRGQYASAKFADTLAKKGAGAIGEALWNAGAEAISPKERLSFRDLQNPEFKKNNPVASELIGFIADVALDPTTYLSFGTGRAIKAGGKALSAKGAAKVGEVAEGALRASKAAFVQAPLVPALGNVEARELADSVVARLATSDASLLDKGGIKFAGQTVVSSDALAKVAKLTGLTAVRDAIAETKLARGLKAFNRDADLPQEYLDIRKSLEADYSRIGREVTQDTLKLFGGLSPAEREAIGDVASKINDVTTLEQKLKGRRLTNVEADAIRQQAMASVKWTPKQKAIYAQMQMSFKEAGELEIQAGLLTHLIQNYTPRIYEALKNGEAMKIYKRNRQGLSTFLSSSEARVFDTLEEAKRLGYVPELDAAALYAQRLISSRKKLAHDQFNKGINGLFGKELPTRIKEDLDFIGEGIYPQSWGESGRLLAEMFDSFNRPFKKLATVARPAFGVKQVFSNGLQGFVVQGAKAFGVLDPRIAIDAMDIVANQGARFDLKTALGTHYTKDELTELVKAHDILRGTTVAGDSFSRTLKSELRNAQVINRLSMGNEAAEGAMKFAQGMGNYMAWPGHVEDYARTALFLNGLRIGHSPKDAAALVDKALFNYGNGLSALEARYVKRLIPFYSFQRFALPLVASLGKDPGRLAAMAKGQTAFFNTWNKLSGGDTLTPAERRVVPGFILEQNSFLEGFDPEFQAKFKSFNSFSPLDVLGGVIMDEKGGFDFERTMQKATLGQLMPVLKWSLEIMVGKKFFNDRLVKEGGRLGDVKTNELIGNIVGLVAAQSGGVFPGALGKLVGDQAGNLTPPEVVKRLLGWEEATDINGKRNVFINPYLAHVVESFVPAWGEVVRQSKPEMTPLEKVESLIGGIGTTKVDLQKSADIRLSEQRKKFEELKHDYRKALVLGRSDQQSRTMEDLNDVLKTLADDAAIAATSPPVRGGLR